MMNLFNEWFVRNTSKKIRAVWQAKGKSGERLAVIPPYGYRMAGGGVALIGFTLIPLLANLF